MSKCSHAIATYSSKYQSGLCTISLNITLANVLSLRLLCTYVKCLFSAARVAIFNFDWSLFVQKYSQINTKN